MGAPQIIMICLLAMGAAFNVADGAKSPEAAKQALLKLFGTGVSVGLLWWGGFWS